ncbi:hypothetical protein ACHGLA_32970 [Streptomyces sp. YH02]|uniref:hypothetical protein n=1 Tax=Streptomyces sp. YH02 TaxID=3256999 RepID=UPI0037569697
MIKGGAKRSLPAIEQRPRQEVRTNHERCPATSDFADRLPAVPPALPEHPRARRGPVAYVCEALDHELLPKNIEGTRAKLKRLVKLGILTEIDTGSFARKQ